MCDAVHIDLAQGFGRIPRRCHDQRPSCGEGGQRVAGPEDAAQRRGEVEHTLWVEAEAPDHVKCVRNEGLLVVQYELRRLGGAGGREDRAARTGQRHRGSERRRSGKFDVGKDRLVECSRGQGFAPLAIGHDILNAGERCGIAS